MDLSLRNNLPIKGDSEIDFSRLTREEFKQVVLKARALGLDLRNNSDFIDTIERFRIEFDERNGQADYTKRNLEAGWRYYLIWCDENGYYDDALPSSPSLIEDYLNYRASFVSKSTLSLDCWAISTTHRVCGCPNPFDDFNVDTTKKKLFRQTILNSDGDNQAYGFRFKHLKELYRLLKDSHDQLHMRTLCIVFIAYESMLRESELARTKISHIKKDDEGCSLKIPYTKTNKSGEVEYAYLSEQALSLLKRYLKLSNRNLKSPGYLFRPLSRSRKALTSDTVISVDVIDNAFHKAHHILGLDDICPRFSSHSARVGASQDLAVSGSTVTQIMQAGRWNSEKMVIRYCKRFFAAESGMAIMRRQQKDMLD